MRLPSVENQDREYFRIAFMMRYGHYKFLVMSFGLTNASATFINLMNRMFKLFLNRFVIVFIEYILVYSKRKEKYKENLRCMLRVLREKKLYAKLKEYEFSLKNVAFLSLWYQRMVFW